MSSTNIGTTFTDVHTTGPKRNFNLVGSSDCVIVFECANASNATSGGRLKDPHDPSRALELRGPNAHSLALEDAAPYVRYVVLDGTVTSCWMDDAPMPDTGPAGPQGGDWTVTALKTANCTAAAGELVLCDPSSAGFTVTFPAAASAGAGKRCCVKNTTTSTNTITIGHSGSDTIEGASTGSIAASKGVKTYVSDGVSNWILT